MKKKILTLLLICIFLFASISSISAIENNTKIEYDHEAEDTSTTVKEKFYLGKIESSGWGFTAVNNPALIIIEYLDQNATTTITSLFGLHSITLKGTHTLTMIFPSRLGLINAPISLGNCNLGCRALIVEISYN